MWRLTIQVPKIDLEILKPPLEALVQLNMIYLRKLWTPLYDQDVVYRQEERREDWNPVPIAIRLGHADCEDLASWLAAEKRLQGIYAEAFPMEMPSRNGKLYHVVVRYEDGRIEDPSRKLGM